jgi:RimJ/RimL family protein N-acetyltransferase
LSAFPADVRLVSERLVLRPFGPGDAAAVTAAIAAREDFLPANAPVSAEGVPHWLTRGVQQVRASGWGLHLAVADRDSGELAGTIGLFRADWIVGSAEVGYGVRPAWRGRGVATEALRLISGWALRDCGLYRVELRTDLGNTASMRVAGKAGFRREGVLRGVEIGPHGHYDQVVFSLIAPDLGERPSAAHAGLPLRTPAAVDRAVSALAARGENTVVLHDGGHTATGAREMLPKLPADCFVEAGHLIGDVMRSAGEHGVAQVVFVGMLGTLGELAAGPPADGPGPPAWSGPLAEITTVMGGSAELAAQVARADTARQTYELWESAGLLGPCGRELCRRVAGVLERHASAPARTAGPEAGGPGSSPGLQEGRATGRPAAQVVLVDFTGTRMVGMYGRLAPGRS